MPMGLVGRKCGMTRVFTEDGHSIPVTVIEVAPNRVTQTKTVESEGYRGVQVTVGSRRASRVNKAATGHFAKAGVEAGDCIKEFRLDENELPDIKNGDELTVALFKEGQFIDVRGISKGKGFQGGVKRHNFKTQDATHGNSLSHRALGSTGQCQTPGRVFKGKKMAGQMGNKQCVAQNQKIVKVDAERHLILVKGAIPGAPGGRVMLTTSVKAKGEEQ
ncbi:MAG: 50S ribosomal protein L3 [Gammaproteobacteria bacterium]|nr:50S ribosomal protein L3 [Gammaproteobacteria bacterium]MCH9744876.1 50S ribosomal protein L3 [Gammaproteobacteria bacterium]